MTPKDKDKLNQCLDILKTTDLGLSLVWLWTWDTIKDILADEEYKAMVTEDEIWEHLCEHVKSGNGFSLEYGTEQVWEDIQEWMLNNDYITYPEDEDEGE